LTRGKIVGITVYLRVTVKLRQADRTTMAGKPCAIQPRCPVPAIVVNQALNVNPLVEYG
jgi:hypothetical protein